MRPWKKLAAGTFAIAMAGAVAAQPSLSSQEWSFDAVDRVEVDGLAADLIIRPGGGAGVTLELAADVRPAGAFRAEVDMVGTTLEARERWGSGSSRGSAEWTLTVPADADIEIVFNTTSGSLEAAGVSARIDFDSTSGDIRLESMTVAADSVFDTTSGNVRIDDATIPARAVFDTTSGDVILRNVTVTGRVSMDTASGDIELFGVRAQGGFAASTASGDVRVEGSEGAIEASSASGNVRVADSSLTGRSEFTSASGDVNVSLNDFPADGLALSSASGDVDLHASFPAAFTLVMSKRQDRGRIDSPFEISSEEEYTRRGQAYERQTTQRGSGGPEIRLRTASGTIRVRQR